MRADLVLLGELGLSGELRAVRQTAARLNEAMRLGFTAAVVPHRLRMSQSWPEGIKILEARSLSQALKLALLTET